MQDRYLEITFRKGKPLAAYLYLARESGARSAKSEAAGKGLIVDLGPDGKPIGVEITSPGSITLGDMNDLLCRYGLLPLSSEELAPLQAA
jgi:hypothetical protein